MKQCNKHKYGTVCKTAPASGLHEAPPTGSSFIAHLQATRKLVFYLQYYRECL